MHSFEAPSDDDEIVDLDREAAVMSQWSDLQISVLSTHRGVHPANSKTKGKRTPTRFSEVKRKECGDAVQEIGKNEMEDGRFKIVGEQNVPSTSTPRQVVSEWVSGAFAFSARINEADGVEESADAFETSPNSHLSNISPHLVTSLEAAGISRWFPVQKAVLPTLLSDSTSLVMPSRDVVISAPTGSGKTLCYVIPILNALMRQDVRQVKAAPLALIVVPTRDLAEQVHREFVRYGGPMHAQHCVLLSGCDDYEAERQNLFSKSNNGTCAAHVIVASPGRLVEHLVDGGEPKLDLASLRYLVVDEADRMQSMARMEWLKLVESRANVPHMGPLTYATMTQDPSRNRWLQKILLSATLSLDVDKLHTWNLRAPRLFKAESNTDASVQAATALNGSQQLILPPQLERIVILCEPSMKPLLLHYILELMFNGHNGLRNNHVPPEVASRLGPIGDWRRGVIFANTRQASQRLNLLLGNLSSKTELRLAEISKNLIGKRRFKCLKRFRSGETQILISSDITSHGIDVEGVDCVVNYDMPINERIFVHRAGRTARAARKGFLLSLVTKEEKMRMKKLLSPHALWNNDELVDMRQFSKNLPPDALQIYNKALHRVKEDTTMI